MGNCHVTIALGFTGRNETDETLLVQKRNEFQLLHCCQVINLLLAGSRQIWGQIGEMITDSSFFFQLCVAEF